MINYPKILKKIKKIKLKKREIKLIFNKLILISN